MKYSIVIPAHNEADSVERTLDELTAELGREGIDYELLVIDDASTDSTATIVERVHERDPRVVCIRSAYPRGFGFAVRAGLDRFTGEAVAIVMADGSDSPADAVRYFRVLEEYDCAFGSRFLANSVVNGYPPFKFVLNRIANFCIRLLFRHGYNDTTNAFKAYRREVIDTCQPLLSNHFNLTVELPLKAIVRGHSFAILPISWTNRTAGKSKLSLHEMGSRYLFIILYVFLERHLSLRDCHWSTRLPKSEMQSVSPRLGGAGVGSSVWIGGEEPEVGKRSDPPPGRLE